MIRDQVLLISCFVAGRAGSSRAAAHLINADLTGHAAAAADSQLPAAPAATEKTFSRVTTPHQRDLRISYVINLDLFQRGHHRARRAAGSRVLSSSLWSKKKKYLRLVIFDSCFSFRQLNINCHLPPFNRDTDKMMFSMADFLPIKLSALIWYWPV